VTNGKLIRLLVDDEHVRYGQLLSHDRVLDFCAGALNRTADWCSPTVAQSGSRRFASFPSRIARLWASFTRSSPWTDRPTSSSNRRADVIEISRDFECWKLGVPIRILRQQRCAATKRSNNGPRLDVHRHPPFDGTFPAKQRIASMKNEQLHQVAKQSGRLFPSSPRRKKSLSKDRTICPYAASYY
jgi:hypothetical protein